MTYTDYTAMLAALTVSGVAKRFTEAPAQLTTAHLPAQWPRLPSGNTEVAALDGSRGLTTYVCDLVIAVEAVGQNTQPANWKRAMALIDAMQAAIVAAVGSAAHYRQVGATTGAGPDRRHRVLANRRHGDGE